MSDNFDFRQWMHDNRMGPYSKDPIKGKSNLNESMHDAPVEEAPVPPSPENIYDTQDDQEYDFADRFMGLGGNQVISLVKDLMQDGFDLEDIFDAIRMHVQEGMYENEQDISHDGE